MDKHGILVLLRGLPYLFKYGNAWSLAFPNAVRDAFVEANIPVYATRPLQA
jgi:hypothetical protein